MGKCKTKTIQLDLGICTNILAYSGIFRILCNPGIFRTVAYPEPEAYLEPWYTEKPDIFKTRDVFRTLSRSYDVAFCENS